MKYMVGCTVTYNGYVEIEADNGMEAIKKADDMCYYDNLNKFPDEVYVGDIKFTFGEAKAEYATEIDF